MMFNELTFGLYCCISAKFGERKKIVLKYFDVDVGHVCWEVSLYIYYEHNHELIQTRKKTF